MKYTYVPSGVCSERIDLDIEDGILTDISFKGGCNGNLRGIAVLAKGQKLEDLKERLRGIKCGRKATSCPDQLSKAITEALEKESENDKEG